MQDQFEWRKGRTTVFKCFYHLVLTPKYRRNVFTHAMLEGLEPVIGETCEQMGGELLEFGAEDDQSAPYAVHPASQGNLQLCWQAKGKVFVLSTKEPLGGCQEKIMG